MNRDTLLQIVHKSLDFIERHPLVVFVAWAVVCSCEYWIFGSRSYVRIHDNADSTLAAKLGLVHNIATYGVTWWWPNTLLGVDAVSNAVLTEIDVLLFLVFPGWLAYGLLMFLQRFVAGYFAYKLFRVGMALEILPSLWAALLFADFSQNWLNLSWNGFTMYDIMAIPSIPLVIFYLYKTENMSGKGKVLSGVILGVLVALTSYFVFEFFIIPFVLFWLYFVLRVNFRKTLASITSFLAAWLVVEAPVQIITFLNAKNSQRADWVQSASPSHWQFDVSLIRDIISSNPLFPLFVALVIIFVLYKHKNLHLVFLSLACVVLVMALKPYYTVYIEQNLPSFSGVQLNRIYLNIPFIFAAIGAITLDGVSKYSRRKTRSMGRNGSLWRFANISIVTIVFLISAMRWFVQERNVFIKMSLGANYAAVFQHPGMLALEKARDEHLSRVVVVATPNTTIRYSDAKYSVLQYNTGYLWPSGFETADGYTVLYSNRYQSLWTLVIKDIYPEEKGDPAQFYSIGNKAYLFYLSDSILSVSSSLSFDDTYNTKILALLNVRYIVSNLRLSDRDLCSVYDGSMYADMFSKNQSITELVYSYFNDPLYDPLFVYRNPYAFPRYFAASRLKTFPTSETLLKALGNATLDEIRNNVYVMDDDFPHKASVSGLGEGKTRILSYTPDCCRIEVTSKTGCILVASASYNPYWNTYIDGKSAELFPAYYALQGVVVPAGCKTVEFRYEPPYAL